VWWGIGGCRLLRTAYQAGQMALVLVGAMYLQTELGSIVTDSAIKHIHPSETIADMFLLLTPNETILATNDYLDLLFLGLAGSCGEATCDCFGHCSPGEFEESTASLCDTGTRTGIRVVGSADCPEN
jgi:hypothetical protein